MTTSMVKERISRFLLCVLFMVHDFHNSTSAIHSDTISRFQKHGCIAAAHHGRDSHLTSHDRSMRKRSADIVTDGGKTREERSPTHIGRHRYQNFTRLNLIPILHTFNATDNSLH